MLKVLQRVETIRSEVQVSLTWTSWRCNRAQRFGFAGGFNALRGGIADPVPTTRCCHTGSPTRSYSSAAVTRARRILSTGNSACTNTRPSISGASR